MGSRTHPGQVVAVIPPPTSGGAARSAPVLRCRNSSCLTEAGERAGGGGGARQSLHRPGRKTILCGGAAPPLVPARSKGLAWCCGAPGRYGAGRRGSSGARIGHRPRAALGGWSLPLIHLGAPPWENLWRRPLWPTLMVSFIVGLSIWRGGLCQELPLERFLFGTVFGSDLFLLSVGVSLSGALGAGAGGLVFGSLRRGDTCLGPLRVSMSFLFCVCQPKGSKKYLLSEAFFFLRFFHSFSLMFILAIYLTGV